MRLVKLDAFTHPQNLTRNEFIVEQLKFSLLNFSTAAIFFAMAKGKSTSNLNNWRWAIPLVITQEFYNKLQGISCLPFRKDDSKDATLTIKIMTYALYMITFSSSFASLFTTSLATKKIIVEPLIKCKLRYISKLLHMINFSNKTLFLTILGETALFALLIQIAPYLRQRQSQVSDLREWFRK